MANPNLASVETIQGFGISAAVTTSDIDIISNVASDWIYKVTTLMISNIDAVNTATVSIKVRCDGATFFEIGPAIAIPPKTVLTFVDRNNSIYLEPTDYLRISASASGDLVYYCGGEKMYTS